MDAWIASKGVLVCNARNHMCDQLILCAFGSGFRGSHINIFTFLTVGASLGVELCDLFYLASAARKHATTCELLDGDGGVLSATFRHDG